MLKRIEAENFFVFEDFSVDFPEGMAIISGETGSGKSMVLHSMGLVLGDSFQYDLIRNPEKETRIRMIFDLSQNEAARQWLDQHQLSTASGDSLEILRSARYKKSSRACINGRTADLARLKELAEHLIEVHGQQTRHSLFAHRVQLAAIDDFAQSGSLLKRVQKLASAISQIRAQIEEINRENPESIDLLRYQAEELAAADLCEGEWEDLQLEHQRLSNYEQYRASLDQLSQLFSGEEDDSLVSRLEKSFELANNVRESNQSASELAEMIERARIEVQEATGVLNSLLDPGGEEEDRAAALVRVDDRVSNLFDLARKHKVEPAHLLQHYQSLQERLSNFDQRATRLAELGEMEQSQLGQWSEVAGQLSKKRRAKAAAFSTQINLYLKELNMPYADFRVEFEGRPAGEVHPLGQERVRFLISTVKGKAHEPINQVSSGGELSRISLATRLCANLHNARSGIALIFDEIDTGIGGESADRLGKLLGQLSTSQQILCVTHLATVAAYASAHYQVGNRDGRKSVYIKRLNQADRKKELARMLTGDQASKHSLQTAGELLERAASRPGVRANMN